MKTKYFKFLSVFVAVIIAFSCFSFTAFASADYTTNDGYATYPVVTNSSIDYGFINYSVPYVENLNGSILGGSALFSPYFNDFSPFVTFDPQTGHYYSYSASAVLARDAENSFVKNTTYLAVMSLNFDRSVYKASFKIYLDSRCSFGSTYHFSSFGGDNLAQWDRTIQSNYLYISIYNINHPVRFFFQFKPTSSNLDEVGFNISLAEVTYLDDSAAQIANDNANTDKIIANQNSNSSAQQSNDNKNTNSIISNQNSNSSAQQSNDNKNTDKITANQNANTNKVLDAGSDTNQPDFAGTNGSLDSTTNQMNALENQYKIDPTSTNQTLSSGSAFLSSSDMNKASIQVKSWIEKFSSENSVFTSFIVAALCLGLCFWVIGRKAGS